MDTQLDYTKLYTGSSITLRILERYLNESDIATILKDNKESARLGGFGTAGEVNELFVFEKDLPKAKVLLADFLKENTK